MLRRIVVDAGAALLQDDVALGGDVLLGEAQIGHAVRFHRHHLRQAILGHALEIGGDVVIGEGVVLAAVPGDDLGELAGGIASVPLNIRCSRKWAMPDEPARLVGGADLVPDHLGHHRSAMVGNDQDLQAVAERELARPAAGLALVPSTATATATEARLKRGEDQARTSIERARKLIEHRHHHGS